MSRILLPRLYSPPPETHCFLDEVQRFVNAVVGPDDAATKILIQLQPFRMAVETDYGVKLTIEAPGRGRADL